jgi:DNA polymerase-1
MPEAFRECISQDGYVIVGADYSQIELRVLAHISQDSNLLEAYQKGKDIHQMTADACNITRDKAKTVNFGTVYGMGIQTLAKRTNKTYEEAEVFLQKYHETYPKVKEFWKNAEICIKEKGFVETVTGRKRRRSKEFFDKDSFEQSMETRSMINHVIQGSASDVIKLAMVLVYPELQKINARIILSVHDELVITCPKNKVKEGLEVLKSSMKKAWEDLNFSVPIEIDINWGKNWCETHTGGFDIEEETIDEEE